MLLLQLSFFVAAAIKVVAIYIWHQIYQHMSAIFL
jgi:hypothetical protein